MAFCLPGWSTFETLLDYAVLVHARLAALGEAPDLAAGWAQLEQRVDRAERARQRLRRAQVASTAQRSHHRSRLGGPAARQAAEALRLAEAEARALERLAAELERERVRLLAELERHSAWTAGELAARFPEERDLIESLAGAPPEPPAPAADAEPEAVAASGGGGAGREL